MKLCEHCKKKLQEAGELPEWPEETEDHEQRQRVVAQNGPSGCHYEIVQPWEDDFEQAEDL